MANVYGVNPIVLDTFTSEIDVGNTLFGDSNARIKVERIIWANPTTLSHTLAITDGEGNPIANATCTTVGETKRVAEAGWFKGIKIAAGGVGSGKVYIYLHSGA